MATYDEAKSQYGQKYQQAYGKEADAEGWGDFENLYKKSSDYSVAGGQGLDNPEGSFNELLGGHEKTMQTRATNQGPTGPSGPSSGGTQPTTAGWLPGQQQPSAGGAGGGRSDELYGLLRDRATQSLNIDRNDPIIRTQGDAFAAQQDRARRNYISDTAEQAGPYANIQGERRMATERMGQAVGGFEAELMGRELTARRQEITQALQMMGGQLSDEQRLALQRELSMMDNALRQQQLNSQNDQFSARLGFDHADRSRYYDLIERGLLG